MNAIVQTNLVNAASAASPTDPHQQTKADDAKRLSAAEIMNRGAVASPAQMMHAMVQVNAGQPQAPGSNPPGQWEASRPTTNMRQMEAAARPLPKPQAAPAKDHEAMTQDALAALRAIPPNPEARRVHTTHSTVGAPGAGSSSSAQESASTDQVTQVVGNFSLSALVGNQGADRHEDED